jgi:hypothetical protein
MVTGGIMAIEAPADLSAGMISLKPISREIDLARLGVN